MSSSGAVASGYNLNIGDFACEGSPIAGGFEINVTTFNVSATGTPGASAIRSAFDDASGEWNSIGAAVSISRGSDTLETSVDHSDATHSIFMTPGAHPTEIGWTAAIECDPDPAFLDCDTAVFTELRTSASSTDAISWNATSGSAVVGKFSLRRAFAHELGHALGLDHPDSGTNTSSIMAAEVYADVLSNGVAFSSSSINTADKDAVKYIYGL